MVAWIRDYAWAIDWRTPGPGFWLRLSWILGLAVGALALPVLPLRASDAMDFARIANPPGMGALLGTDAWGRDLLSRLLHGARVSLSVALLAPLLGLVVGGSLGVAAAWFRGRVEDLISVVLDIWLAFPGLVLALVVMAFVGRTALNLVLVLGLLSVPAFARMARANTLKLTGLDFAAAAIAMGSSNGRILAKAILPNILPTLIAFALTVAPVVLVAEGVLSFSGLGVAPPTPTWGA